MKKITGHSTCLPSQTNAPEKRPVGRPRQAAQTLDDALHAFYGGRLPKRGRNAVERAVMQQRKGPKKDPNAPTNVAAALAYYLVKNDGATLRGACRTAASFYGLHTETVRKALRALTKGPMSKIKFTVPAHFQQLVLPGDVLVPLVPSKSDLPTEWQAIEVTTK